MSKSNAKIKPQRSEPPLGAKRAQNRFRADYPIPEAIKGRPLIDPRETARRVGCHPVTLYRWMRSIEGFPIPIRITQHRIAFFEDEVTAYIDSRPRVVLS